MPGSRVWYCELAACCARATFRPLPGVPTSCAAMLFMVLYVCWVAAATSRLAVWSLAWSARMAVRAASSLKSCLTALAATWNSLVMALRAGPPPLFRDLRPLRDDLRPLRDLRDLRGVPQDAQ